MNRAAVNRYAAIVLLMIAILSAIALKMSLNGQVPEPATITLLGLAGAILVRKRRT